MTTERAGRDFTLPTARSIASADTSDTTVIDPRPEEQISLGTVELRRYDDIRYGTVPGPDGGQHELKLDILRPQTGKRLPLVVFLPGGAFIFSNKVNAYGRRAFVAESGLVVASVEYRTTTRNATYIDSVHDVRNAIAYLVAHADEYGIDPGAIGVWGESAGGYLSAMTAVTNGVSPFTTPGQAGRVDAVIDCFGCSDLLTIGADFDDEYQSYYRENATHFSAYLGAPGKALVEIPNEVHAADPVTYINAATPPFLLLHGTGDVLIAPSQTQRVHKALLAAGVDSTRYLLRGAGHGDMAVSDPESGLPWSSTTTMAIITDFLHRQFNRR